MTEDLMIRGLDLLLYGMGTVVVFLTVLVGLTSLMSRMIVKYLPEAESAVTGEVGDNSAPVSRLTLRILQAAVDRRRTLAGQYGDTPRK